MKNPIWIIAQKRLNSTQGSAMISPNSFCAFVFTRAIDMILDPPFLQNLLNKNEETNLNYYSETFEFYTRFCKDISQLILWICLHKGHRYDFRPAILAKSSEQKWGKKPIWSITRTRTRLSSTQGSAMISPNSFCGFVFTRAIDMGFCKIPEQKWKK